jgi:hypothetical protein
MGTEADTHLLLLCFAAAALPPCLLLLPPGERLHVLDLDNDGLISAAELTDALRFLRANLDEQDLVALLDRCEGVAVVCGMWRAEGLQGYGSRCSTCIVLLTRTCWRCWTGGCLHVQRIGEGVW